MRALRSRLDDLAGRQLILFGGKGGVGKTTLSLLSAIHFAAERDVTLITTDPAGNLEDFEGDLPDAISVETIDAERLWKDFLDENLEALLDLGDRGTYLDRDELRRFFELSIPGADELMGWNRIAHLARDPDVSLLVVDTAPTGHTLRLLSSPDHWHAMELVMDSMQEKHREIVSHLTRKIVRDALDEFLEEFSSSLQTSEDIFTDRARTAFVPVMTSQPWVVDQTVRLVDRVAEVGIDIPFIVLNHASIDCECQGCGAKGRDDERAIERTGTTTVQVPRACGLFRETTDLRKFLSGGSIGGEVDAGTGGEPPSRTELTPESARLVFVVGKGGVGKTTVATSLALRTASGDVATTLLSIDPAHSVTDVFHRIEAPEKLTVETIDTKAAWKKLEEDVGRSIEEAISGLTPSGFRNVHDEAITKQLLEISPPGADEIFALIRILELWEDDSISRIIVDTAPTGHFVRLLDLPQVAGDWVRELMRITLRYKEILSSSTLGEKLLNASRSLKKFDEVIASNECVALPVTRAEPIVISETLRLIAKVEAKGLRAPMIVVNALAPDNDCPCDAGLRRDQRKELSRIEEKDLILVDRYDPPPTSVQDLIDFW